MKNCIKTAFYNLHISQRRSFLMNSIAIISISPGFNLSGSLKDKVVVQVPDLHPRTV